MHSTLIALTCISLLRSCEFVSGSKVLDGNFQTIANVPQGPVNDPSPPIHVNPTTTTTSRPPTSSVTEPLPPSSSTPEEGEQEEAELQKYCLSPRGQYPGRYCNSFVNCWDGNVVEQFCGTGLVFNPLGFCDYAGNVDCQGKPIKDDSNISNGWPTDGSYISPSSEPTHDSPLELPYEPPAPELPTIRPPTLPTASTSFRPLYDPVSSSIEPETGSAAIIFPPGHYLRRYCLAARGQFASPHCNRFVNCWDDVVVEQDCPLGLHFNPLRGYCDFPHNYPCKLYAYKHNVF